MSEAVADKLAAAIMMVGIFWAIAWWARSVSNNYTRENIEEQKTRQMLIEFGKKEKNDEHNV
jgi:hypothetical protein